jgi:AraC-like DNA-binding protein
VFSKLPLPSERIYAPYKIAALVEVLGEQGIPADACLHGTGVNVSQLRDGATLTSVRQYADACQNALRLSQDPSTPFQVGSRLHLSAYGMYGYALMSCLSLRDYFNLGVKYHFLATPTLTIEWQEGPDAAIWRFPDEFSFAPSGELRQFLIEQQFTQQATHIQDVAGVSCPPTRANFSFKQPHYIDIYEKYLRCPCFFDQDRCELHYDSSILDWKPQMAHHLTTFMFQEACDNLVGKAKTSVGIAGEIYQILMRSPSASPNMEDAAKSLHMTARTLRRRLELENITFSTIVDDFRRSLAIEYLSKTKLNYEDIAVLVGFSDVANFRRAFKRWTQKTVGDFRGRGSRKRISEK